MQLIRQTAADRMWRRHDVSVNWNKKSLFHYGVVQPTTKLPFINDASQFRWFWQFCCCFQLTQMHWRQIIKSFYTYRECHSSSSSFELHRTASAHAWTRTVVSAVHKLHFVTRTAVVRHQETRFVFYPSLYLWMHSSQRQHDDRKYAVFICWKWYKYTEKHPAVLSMLTAYWLLLCCEATSSAVSIQHSHDSDSLNPCFICV